MKRQILVLLALLAVVINLTVSAHAQEVTTTVVQFRSVADPSVPEQPGVCDPSRLGFVPNAVRTGSLWSSASRSNNGVVVNEKIRQIGTVTSCLLFTDLGFAPFGPEVPVYLSMRLEDLDVESEGRCQVTINVVPENGPLFFGCHLTVIPERSTPGIRWGHVATSTSATLAPIPGFEAGSFYTVWLIWE